MSMIEDGKGTGYKVGVTNKNQLLVSSSSIPVITYISENEQNTFQVHAQNTISVAGTFEPVGQFKYTGDKKLHIESIVFSREDVNLGVSKQSVWEVLLYVGYSSGGDTVDPINMNIGSGNISSLLAYSAIDNNLHSNIEQFEILKSYCKSVLRCVSFNFNTKNKKGLEYSVVQNWIFNNYDVLDTVFRCGKSNELYKNEIINIKETKFLGKKCYTSKFNKKTYFGNCNNCLEKCGISNIN